MNATDDVSISTPCPLRWDDLVGDERVRFCSQCARHVHNLSALSRAQVQQLRAREPDLCAMIRRAPDGGLITSEPRAARRRWAAAMLRGAASILATFGAVAASAVDSSDKCPATPRADGAQESSTADPGAMVMGRVSHDPANEELPAWANPARTPGPLPKEQLQR